ncbi:hypothetical protein K1X76_00910 [bacterium]|nr:hypothetical protein [bacterium]
MTTPNRMQEHWSDLKIYIKQEWPRFSDATIENVNGDFDRFLKHLKDLYNNFPLEEAKARSKIQAYLNHLEGLAG